MGKMLSCTGRILRIDLRDGSSRVEDSTAAMRTWLGGAGLAIKTLYDEIPAGTDPFGPENKLIFSSGLLIGTLAPSACKMSVSTLGPMTGGWATGSCDSYLGVQMKQAGYDQIIIEGCSKKPCVVYVTDKEVQILNAEDVWGLASTAALHALRERLGDDSLHMMLIGPAGEHLVRGACIIHDNDRAIGRGGIGAVMGAKRIKALICKGSIPIQVADPDTFMSLASVLRERLINSPATPAFHKYGSLAGGTLEAKQENCGIPYKNGAQCSIPREKYEKIDFRALIDKYEIRKKNFIACPLGCSRELLITDGPYAGLQTSVCQFDAVEAFYARLALEEPTAILAVNACCNELGLDIVTAGCAIGWAMECYEHGLLSAQDTGGIALEWGNDKLVMELLRMMAYREGFGDVLAEGSARAAERIGRDSDRYAVYCKKQDQVESLRGANIWALGILTSTRGGGHTTGLACYEQTTMIDPERLYQIPGVVDLDKPQSYKGKAEAVYYLEALCRVCNCTGICLCSTVWSGLNKDYLNLQDLAELLTAATGEQFSEESLIEIAMRQLLLEKAFNLRHTGFCRQDDMPRARELTDPIGEGRLKGWKFDRAKLETMLDDYYMQHGWDAATSFPTRSAYDRYGLRYVADEMELLGKLGEEQ